jgi:hypothetical protein
LPLVEIPNDDDGALSESFLAIALLLLGGIDSETVRSKAGDGSPGILRIGIGSHTGLSGSSAS